MADPHAQIGRTVVASDPEMPFADLCRDHGGQIGRRIDALVDQVPHRRRKDKVACLEDE